MHPLRRAVLVPDPSVECRSGGVKCTSLKKYCMSMPVSTLFRSRHCFHRFDLKVCQLIEPGPVVLLVTARKGIPNIKAMSWHMMMKSDPPLVGCICSSATYSFEALRKNVQCVIAIPTRKLAPMVVKVGNTSGRDLDKCAAFGLTPTPAAQVSYALRSSYSRSLQKKNVETDKC